MAGPGFRFTECGCRACQRELHNRFAKLVLPQWSVADEKNALLAALQEIAQSKGVSKARDTFFGAPTDAELRAGYRREAGGKA